VATHGTGDVVSIPAVLAFFTLKWTYRLGFGALALNDEGREVVIIMVQGISHYFSILGRGTAHGVSSMGDGDCVFSFGMKGLRCESERSLANEGAARTKGRC